MRKFLTIAVIAQIISICHQGKAEEEYILPKLPSLDLNSIQNEIDELEEKTRSPSNAKNVEIDEYKEAEESVKTWDYQNVIDRHDKH